MQRTHPVSSEDLSFAYDSDLLGRGFPRLGLWLLQLLERGFGSVQEEERRMGAPVGPFGFHHTLSSSHVPITMVVSLLLPGLTPSVPIPSLCIRVWRATKMTGVRETLALSDFQLRR